MEQDKRKRNRVFFYSTPNSIDDKILKRFLEQENNDPKLHMVDIDWKVDFDRSKYPYGLGKEWAM